MSPHEAEERNVLAEKSRVLSFIWDNGYIRQWANQLQSFISGQAIVAAPVTTPDMQPEPEKTGWFLTVT